MSDIISDLGSITTPRTARKELQEGYLLGGAPLQGPLLLTANARNCQRDANQSTIKTVHVNVKTYGNQKDGRKRISITTYVTSTMSTITVAVNVGASTTTTANTRTTANNFIY